MNTLTSDSSFITAHSLQLGVKFAGAAYTSYSYQSFTKNVIAPICATSSIALPSAKVDSSTGNFIMQEYNIGDSQLTIDVGALVVTPIAGKSACAVTYASAVVDPLS